MLCRLIVGNLQSVLDVTTKCTDTSKTGLVCDNKILFFYTSWSLYPLNVNAHVLATRACIAKPVVYPLQHVHVNCKVILVTCLELILIKAPQTVKISATIYV